MKNTQAIALDSVLSGFQGMLFDDPDMLRYAVKGLCSRYLESHKDAGRKVTTKSYLAAIGALEANNIQLKKELEEMEARAKAEKKKVKK